MKVLLHILELELHHISSTPRELDQRAGSREVEIFDQPPIVKGKPNVVYWSDPKTQRKPSKPQN